MDAEETEKQKLRVLQDLVARGLKGLNECRYQAECPFSRHCPAVC
jgi:hypothetical protein